MLFEMVMESVQLQGEVDARCELELTEFDIELWWSDGGEWWCRGVGEVVKGGNERVVCVLYGFMDGLLLVITAMIVTCRVSK